MIKIENTEVNGWEAAIRGMRNPMNSWARIDTKYDVFGGIPEGIGPNDLDLMKRLAHGGPVHGKYLRMITVTADITAPFYWWKEYDTYKVGTVASSCSTMHKIHSKEFTLDDFSHEHLCEEALKTFDVTICALNFYREQFLMFKDKEWWWHLIQLLPSSYNQRRTVQLNYEVLRGQYKWRKDHKLDEWHAYCDWALTLPYFEELCVEETDHE